MAVAALGIACLIGAWLALSENGPAVPQAMPNAPVEAPSDPALAPLKDLPSVGGASVSSPAGSANFMVSFRLVFQTEPPREFSVRGVFETDSGTHEIVSLALQPTGMVRDVDLTFHERGRLWLDYVSPVEQVHIGPEEWIRLNEDPAVDLGEIAVGHLAVRVEVREARTGDALPFVSVFFQQHAGPTTKKPTGVDGRAWQPSESGKSWTVRVVHHIPSLAPVPPLVLEASPSVHVIRVDDLPYLEVQGQWNRHELDASGIVIRVRPAGDEHAEWRQLARDGTGRAFVAQGTYDVRASYETPLARCNFMPVPGYVVGAGPNRLELHAVPLSGHGFVNIEFLGLPQDHGPVQIVLTSERQRDAAGDYVAMQMEGSTSNLVIPLVAGEYSVQGGLRTPGGALGTRLHVVQCPEGGVALARLELRPMCAAAIKQAPPQGTFELDISAAEATSSARHWLDATFSGDRACLWRPLDRPRAYGVPEVHCFLIPDSYVVRVRDSNARSERTIEATQGGRITLDFGEDD